MPKIYVEFRHPFRHTFIVIVILSRKMSVFVVCFKFLYRCHQSDKNRQSSKRQS